MKGIHPLTESTMDGCRPWVRRTYRTAFIPASEARVRLRRSDTLATRAPASHTGCMTYEDTNDGGQIGIEVLAADEIEFHILAADGGIADLVLTRADVADLASRLVKVLAE